MATTATRRGIGMTADLIMIAGEHRRHLRNIKGITRYVRRMGEKMKATVPGEVP